MGFFFANRNLQALVSFGLSSQEPAVSASLLVIYLPPSDEDGWPSLQCVALETAEDQERYAQKD